MTWQNIHEDRWKSWLCYFINKEVLLMYKHLLTQSLTTTTWWHCLWLLYLCIYCDVPSSLEWFCSSIKQVENLLFSVRTFESSEVDTCSENLVDTELNPTLSYTQVFKDANTLCISVGDERILDIAWQVDRISFLVMSLEMNLFQILHDRSIVFRFWSWVVSKATII